MRFFRNPRKVSNKQLESYIRRSGSITSDRGYTIILIESNIIVIDRISMTEVLNVTKDEYDNITAVVNGFTNASSR